MTDRDSTPGSGRPTTSRPSGREPALDGAGLGVVADPPTVRSNQPVRSASGGSGLRGASITATGVPSLPLPGDRVGDFGLEEAIGAGGMGAVFRAVDIKLDRQVALKILPPDQAVDPDVVQRYYQEGRAAARLDDENIARVYSIGHDGTYHYICFEYIEGTTLRQRVEADGPLPVGDAINFTLQIANALVHANQRGVVHRDIKPSNIIVTPQGRAKLVDMGLARRFERGEDTGLTQSGMTLGTFDYISPEQAKDPRTVDVRGDLYSLGCTLFHMLSGRPPFPEGTVLQKLLQHAEEAPPDIRSLNPAVPDDLSAILVKLMAKDRDRRFQTPELLVRDLLTVAESFGIRSINPQGQVGLETRPAPAWSKHLVWGIPALVLSVILGGLAWWGDGPTATSTPLTEKVAPAPSLKPRPVPSSIPTAPTTPTPEFEAPRDLMVDSREDLFRVLTQAPPKSRIILSDRGPYDLRGAKAGPLKGLDLTIQADTGIRPVIRLPRDIDEDDGPVPSALIHLVGGRIVFDGIEFEVDGAETSSAIRSEEADLVVRRCLFRRSVAALSRSMPSAIAFRAASLSNGRPSALSVEANEFGAGQAGVLVAGLAEVGIRDCTFGPPSGDQATFRSENVEPGASPSEWAIAHVSVLTGDGPVFRFEGVPPRIRVRASAFAPPSPTTTPSALVSTDSADRLDWRGFDNLYGRFGAFLIAPKGSGQRPTLRSFDAWSEDVNSFLREVGSIAVEFHPWLERNPLESLALNDPGPSRSFRLALPRQAPPKVGARQGPDGLLSAPVALATSPVAPSNSSAPPVESLRPPEIASTATPSPPKVTPPTAIPGGSERPPVMVGGRPKAPIVDDDPDVLTPPDSLSPMPMPMPVDPDRVPVPVAVIPPANPPSTSPKVEGPTPTSPAPPADPGVIRTAEEFRDALNRPGPGLKTLNLAANADLILPPLRFRGASGWVIRAERGSSRPKLRFRPDPQSSPAAELGMTWMAVQSGGLRLEGLDLILAESENPVVGSILSPRRRAVFGLSAGTIDLTLDGCSVTIEGDAGRSSVVAVQSGELGGEARVRLKDCLVRVGDDLVDVGPGRRLDLEVDNAVLVSGGTMVHAHGSPAGQAPEPIKLVLRQVTARLNGGLAHLQSAPGEPDLPTVDANVRDTIFLAREPDAPLLRVDGQGDLDDLRSTIRWEGRSVAYHQINIYRRDQSVQPGAVPILFDREFWDFTLGRREESATHGDLKFLKDPDPARRPWTFRPEDFRLRPDSPAGSAGSDLMHVPNPPTGGP